MMHRLVRNSKVYRPTLMAFTATTWLTCVAPSASLSCMLARLVRLKRSSKLINHCGSTAMILLKNMATVNSPERTISTTLAAWFTSDTEMSDSGRITMTMISSKVSSDARPARPLVFSSSQRYTGANRIARMTPQKMAPAYGASIQPKPMVTMLRRSRNTFWCSVRVCMGGSVMIRVELPHHKRGMVRRAIQLS
ncbi:hypothetical protein D3C72_1135610 [compost metagenome]